MTAYWFHQEKIIQTSHWPLISFHPCIVFHLGMYRIILIRQNLEKHRIFSDLVPNKESLFKNSDSVEQRQNFHTFILLISTFLPQNIKFSHTIFFIWCFLNKIRSYLFEMLIIFNLIVVAKFSWKSLHNKSNSVNSANIQVTQNIRLNSVKFLIFGDLQNF